MRITLLLALIFMFAGILLSGCNSRDPTIIDTSMISGEKEIAGKIIKTDEEWRKILTPGQYEVTRKKGTERAFTVSAYCY